MSPCDAYVTPEKGLGMHEVATKITRPSVYVCLKACEGNFGEWALLI